MAKVVGRDDKFVKRKSCSNCAAIVEFTKNETERKGFSDWTGDTDYHDTLKCPNCSELMIVG